jgi:hypothetical protein
MVERAAIAQAKLQDWTGQGGDQLLREPEAGTLRLQALDEGVEPAHCIPAPPWRAVLGREPNHRASCVASTTAIRQGPRTRRSGSLDRTPLCLLEPGGAHRASEPGQEIGRQRIGLPDRLRKKDVAQHGIAAHAAAGGVGIAHARLGTAMALARRLVEPAHGRGVVALHPPP